MSNMKRYYEKSNPEIVVQYKNAIKELLKKMCALCEKHNVTYSLDCGTLLGFSRDGDMCKNDGDADIYVLAETVTMDFMTELRPLMRDIDGKQTMSYNYIKSSFEKSRFIVPQYIRCEDTSRGYFSLTSPQYPGVDIFLLVKYGEERFCKNPRTYWVRLPACITDETEEFVCPQGKFMATKYVDELLRIYYDDNYKTPQDGFRDEMKSLKYAYWGLVDKEDVGHILINFATGEVKDMKDISMNNQKLLGIVDENGNKTDLDLHKYFKPEYWGEMNHIMRPFLPRLRKRMIDWNLIYGSREKKQSLVKKMWKYMTDEQKEKYKQFYNETY